MITVARVIHHISKRHKSVAVFLRVYKLVNVTNHGTSGHKGQQQHVTLPMGPLKNIERDDTQAQAHRNSRSSALWLPEVCGDIGAMYSWNHRRSCCCGIKFRMMMRRGKRGRRDQIRAVAAPQTAGQAGELDPA